MPPRGNRLACTVKSVDGAQGSFDVYPGEHARQRLRIDPMKWDRPTDKPIQEGAFTVIGDMGMTGQIIVVNSYQWNARWRDDQAGELLLRRDPVGQEPLQGHRGRADDAEARQVRQIGQVHISLRPSVKAGGREMCT